MPSAIEPVDRSASARLEAERQLAAAAERHREVLASMQQLGRSEAGQHVAVKAVGRAVHLVTFALTHAAETGVRSERLAELTGWEPRLVSEALARGPEPSLVARLAPAGLDPRAVAQVAASIEATVRLQALTQRILADIADDAWSPAPADLADLHDRLDSEWRAWRQPLGRQP
jgi:phage baseplate assembly protein W